jgi:hypothetical protein
MEMTLTSFPSSWQKLRALSNLFAGATAKTSDSEQFTETRRAAQQVICENIWSNPEAFSSELEVYYQAHLCRGLE